MSRKIENLLVFAFTFAAFILGTTEYVIVGLLQDISTSLNVSLAASGILVSDLLSLMRWARRLLLPGSVTSRDI